MIQTVLGGQRSGKSAFAESLAERTGLPVCYIATAHRGDDEMKKRIAVHQQRRPPHWRVLEEPVALGQAIATQPAGGCLLIDCLNLWVCNFIDERAEVIRPVFAEEKAALLKGVKDYEGVVVMVSQELSMGLIGVNRLSRQFVDALGEMNQAVASISHRVWLVAAGLPLTLKDETHVA